MEKAQYVVREAERTGRGVAVEELAGIRERARATRSQRRTLHTWAFGQLRAFLEYKAARARVALIAVDPSYTSQDCPGCGHRDGRNRPTRSAFQCVRCGLAGPADHIAAQNIAARGATCWAAVNQPNAE
jgi:IS605 OrfB family transposase